MASVRFRCPDGSIRRHEASRGATVMEVAIREGVPGMVAECGGALTCASCHVYVDPAYLAAVGDVDDIEEEMLQDAAADRRATSRLSCQIEVNDDVDDLIVEIAPVQ